MIKADRQTNQTQKKQHKQAARQRSRSLLKKYRILYLMMAVIVLYYLVFIFAPVAMGFLISLKDMKVGNTIWNAKWVGLKNYVDIFRNPQILGVLKNTVILSISRLFWTFWPPILLAIFIFDLILPRYKRVCQTIVYIPYFFSWVIIYGITFAFFSTNGFVNGILHFLGSARKDFLMNPDYFRSMLIGTQLWKGIGWGTILFFAALTNANPELYEAAKIDGAGPVRRIFAVTLPAIQPVILFSLIMALGTILNNDFEQVLVFYNASVYEVGDIIDTWVYRIGLGKMQYSIGTALGMFKGLIGFVLVLGSNKLSYKIAGRGMW